MQKMVLVILIAAGFISSIMVYDVWQKIYEKKNLVKHLNCEHCFEGPIERIVDANILLIDSRWVILSLVDTPAIGNQRHDEAMRFTAQICKIGENAMVELDKWRFYDRSARNIAQVTCSGKVLNEELLAAGHATILEEQCSESTFSQTTWAQSFGC
jgi:endonuclease YncB( thermonuclease family)